MNEAETRAEHIDPTLAAADWGVLVPTNYQRKLAALDELKKSLLHRAFSGEL